MSPSGLVIMRLVKPEPARVVAPPTTLAATNRTFGTVVVNEPLLVVLPEPLAPTPPTSGLAASSPLYSMMRISGYAAATLKRTVTMLLFAPAATMFGAKYIDWVALPARAVGPTARVYVFPLESVTEATLAVVSFQPTTTTFRFPVDCAEE